MNYGKWEDNSEIHHKNIDLKAQGSSLPSSSAVLLVDGDEASEIDLCSDEPTEILADSPFRVHGRQSPSI